METTETPMSLRKPTEGEEIHYNFTRVMSMDEDKEVIGNLKVSLEAAKALSGIYQEFHQEDETKKKMRQMKRKRRRRRKRRGRRRRRKKGSKRRRRKKFKRWIMMRTGEMSFEQDCLVEGGCLNVLHNGTQYTEVRQYQSAHHLVRFYFVTRVFSAYMRSIIDDLRHGLKPDIVIASSYNTAWLDDYKQNLIKFFGELKSVLPEETLMIWNLAMPLAEKMKGGFLVPEIEHKAFQLRYDVIEGNYYSGTMADIHGMDVLDLHFQFRFSLHHRTNDGVHWNAIAHRKITSLLLQHAAQAWGVDMTCPLRAVGFKAPSAVYNYHYSPPANYLRTWVEIFLHYSGKMEETGTWQSQRKLCSGLIGDYVLSYLSLKHRFTKVFDAQSLSLNLLPEEGGVHHLH
ncbi:hypothetical protein INR49_011681 [Caranx melampygus]|nr:hypothetical protein INR49_011681 [Caranx melampygus]